LEPILCLYPCQTKNHQSAAKVLPHRETIPLFLYISCICIVPTSFQLNLIVDSISRSFPHLPLLCSNHPYKTFFPKAFFRVRLDRTLPITSYFVCNQVFWRAFPWASLPPPSRHFFSVSPPQTACVPSPTRTVQISLTPPDPPSAPFTYEKPSPPTPRHFSFFHVDPPDHGLLYSLTHVSFPFLNLSTP